MLSKKITIVIIVITFISMSISMFLHYKKYKLLEYRYKTQFEELIFQTDDNIRHIRTYMQMLDVCDSKCSILKEKLEQDLMGKKGWNADLWREYVPEEFDTLDTTESPMYKNN